MGIRAQLRGALSGSPLYEPLRHCYQTFFARDRLERTAARKAFYRDFLRRGDLVFDVGANLGHYTETFSALGARVVAVDPDPRNVEFLRKRFPAVPVEACALGSAEGMATLYLADPEQTNCTSLHADWVDRNTVRVGEIPVPVRTLENLVARYGEPRYIKLDTEGHDYDILCGLSFRPEWISFEFSPADLEPALKSIELLGGYEFNFVIEDRFQYECRWNRDIRGALKELCQNSDSQDGDQILYGDIVARRQ
jgi:FkbM family methyltransferase